MLDINFNRCGFLEENFEKQFEPEIWILIQDIYKLSNDYLTEFCNVIGKTYSEILNLEYKDIFNLVDQLSEPERKKLENLAKKYLLERV